MNCLLEAMASLWLNTRRRVVTEPVEEEVVSAQEGLEQCRRNMEAREREFQAAIARLAEEAVCKKRDGDPATARTKLVERRRCAKRLERLRHGLDLVDIQIDAIKTSELDKEIMLTLKASTSAMRKAGISLGVQEVETVMSELDEQMREVQDITDVLSNPLSIAGGAASASSLTEEADLDAELELLEAMGPSLPSASVRSVNNMTTKERPAAAAEPAQGTPIRMAEEPWRPRAAGPTIAVV
jgi:hypothetical protein